MSMRALVAAGAAALFGLSVAAGDARAEDTRPNSAPPKVNKDADNINAANPRVFHAGPGKPLQGTLWVPPAVAAAEKAKAGAEKK